MNKKKLLIIGAVVLLVLAVAGGIVFSLRDGNSKLVTFPKEEEKKIEVPKEKQQKEERQEAAETTQDTDVQETEEAIKKAVLAEMKAIYGEELPAEDYPNLTDRHIRWEVRDIKTYKGWSFAYAQPYIAETQEGAFDGNNVFLKLEGSEWEVVTSGSDTSDARGNEVPADVYDVLISD